MVIFVTSHTLGPSSAQTKFNYTDEHPKLNMSSSIIGISNLSLANDISPSMIIN